MKIGVMKIGASITWQKVSKTAGNFDVHSLIDLLRLSPDIYIDIITRNTRNTWLPEDLHFQDIMKVDVNLQDYDALLVFNGNVNFFGGAEAPDQIMNYYHINKFKGKVIYVQTDGQLQLKQIWPSIDAKPWGVKWKKEDIWVQRDDIIYLSQARRPERVFSLCRKNGSVPVQKELIFHFPIEQAIMCNEEKIIVKQLGKQYDLIYGGSMRGGQRKKLLEKYYFGHTAIESCLFGAVQSKMFSTRDIRPTFLSKVDHHRFMEAMTRGRATCIIGDEWYFDNMHTLRIYETILADVVCFVSNEFDPHRTIFTDPELNEFLYVSSRKELCEKVLKLREDKFRHEITSKQRASINFNRDSYIDRLYGTISKITGKDLSR